MTWTNNFGPDAIADLSFAKPFVAYGWGYFRHSTQALTTFTVTLTRTASSTLDALACADELYVLLPEVTGTHPDDGKRAPLFFPMLSPYPRPPTGATFRN